MDPYATLGVPPHADAREIKKAWRKVASRCHPDKVEALGLVGAEADRRGVRFREAREAWELVGTSEKRAAYDRTVEVAREEAQEAARRRREARETAKRQWEALQASRRAEEADRLRMTAAVQAAAREAQRHRLELEGWMRRADRRERAAHRVEVIERARKVEVGRRWLTVGTGAVTRGVGRVRATIAAMMLEDL